jgi:hypothetical protein
MKLATQLMVLVLIIFLAGHARTQSNSKEYRTETGKIFSITEKHPNGQSLSTIEITSSGFANNLNETIEDSDPINAVIIADLDNNGFDELYIITVSSGSGSYGGILGFASNRDISVSMINFPEIQEDDIHFQSYMGHDSFKVINQQLIRAFPIYLNTDNQNSPSGGMRTLVYGLYPGEAAWQLKIVKSAETE